MTDELLVRWKFFHYADTPPTVLMREIFSGMYVSWDWKDKTFRLMPNYRNGFSGIILPHTTIAQIVAMVAAMGGDWCGD